MRGAPAIDEAVQRQAQTLARRWLARPAEVSLLAHRENTVFKVDDGGKRPFALRLMRARYNSPAAIRSEIAWLRHLHSHGVRVAEPLPALDGEYLHRFRLGGRVRYACASAFVEGDSLAVVLDRVGPDEQLSLWRELGAMMARMHRASDGLDITGEFRRRCWDARGLVGLRPIWGAFWRGPLVQKGEHEPLRAMRRALFRQLEDAAEGLDYGLIHCDLNPDNVLCRREEGRWRLSFIDFDDGGFGYRLYDIIIALFSFDGHKSYDGFRDALLAGYRSVRPMGGIDPGEELMFKAIRAATLFGWLSARLEDCADPERPSRSRQRLMKHQRLYRQALDSARSR